MGDASAFIAEIVQRLAQEAGQCKVILYGSYARGAQTKDSNLNILVVEKEILSSRHMEMVQLRRLLAEFPFPIDVLVVSEAEYLERSDFPSNVYYWAKLEGKILHEST